MAKFRKGVCNVFCQTMKASAGVCSHNQRKAALRAVKTGMSPSAAVAAKCGGGGVHGLGGARNVKKNRVTTRSGDVIYLYTDDTYTLAYPGWQESTPRDLAASVSVESLRRLAQNRDSNIASKAARALTLAV